MATTESEKNRAAKTKGAPAKQEKTKQVKMNRGEVGKFNRRAWNYMIQENKVSQELLSKMKEATCPAKVSGNEVTLIRYFDYAIADAKGVTIKDYMSLNEYPEMIVYEGYVSRGRLGETIIKKREASGKSFLDEKIGQGDITDVGVEVVRTGAQKFLHGFMNFLMMGGFMLVILFIVIIAVAISILAKSC